MLNLILLSLWKPLLGVVMGTKKEKKYHHDMVNERLRQLMVRDPLVIDFQKRMKKFYDDNPQLKKGFHYLKFPSKMQEIHNQIDKKWNVPLIEWVMADARISLTQKILSRITELTPSHWRPAYKVVSHLKEKQADHLYLDIDLTTLDMNDARQVKQQVWQMIKDRLRERIIKDSRPTRIKQSHYKDDRPELAFIYHTKEETFQKYLRSYDIYMREKLGFRLIAYIDRVRKQSEINAEELLKRLRSKKLKWGNPIKGEDAVEKGIKLIHKAIHGADYSAKDTEPINEEYNCPRHGKKCSPGCNYIKYWMGIFNRVIKPEPSLTGRGQTDAEFEAMIHPAARRKRRKPID